jgi:TolB-like protein/AraC-like DNA-binding protein/tetratricopeptide (TPR) repeat protein
MNLSSTNDKEFIQKITEIVLANLGNEKFGVEELVNETGMNPSVIRSRLKNTNNKSISQFIREIRLKKGFEMLQEGHVTVAEIAYHVGFGSPTYFNSCFHEYFGYPPGDVKRKTFTESGETHSENIHEDDEVFSSSGLRDKLKIRKRRWMFVLPFVIILIGIICWIGLKSISEKSGTIPDHLHNLRKESLAVLPFHNLNGGPEKQYLADGLTEDITYLLGYIRSLKVIAPASAAKFRESKLSKTEIARILGVDKILEGSVFFNENKIRISLVLNDSLKEKPLWSDHLIFGIHDINTIAAAIIKKVVHKTGAAISDPESGNILKKATRNPVAYDFYLSALFYRSKGTRESQKESMGYFEKALQADPEFTLAQTGLAEVYFNLAWSGFYPRAEGYNKAKELVLGAQKLDANNAEVHTVLGAILCWSDWKWEEARKELITALDLNPNSVSAYTYFSQLCDILRENQEARKLINIAIELDPLSAELYVSSALCFYHEENFNASLEDYMKAARLDPIYLRGTWTNYFRIYMMLGEELKAIESYQKYMLLEPLIIKEAGLIRKVYDTSGINGVLNWILGLAQIKGDIPKNNFWFQAAMYCMLDRKPEALNCLEKMKNEQTGKNAGMINFSDQLPRINNDPVFIHLRSEQRFMNLLNTMGLTAYSQKTNIPNIF